MADGTAIEWTDATVNAINGCSLASPGCTNCYAMKQAHRFPVRQGLTKKTKGGMVWTGEVRFNEKALEQVLSWKRPRRIFWNAHGDTFHESVPNEWIDRCFDVMAHTPQHIHQVLTKRADRMRAYFEELPARVRGMDCHAGLDFADFPLPNVWLGVSVEDQKRADERIPDLLATPAAVRWLSCEPLLGPVDLTNVRAKFWTFSALDDRKWTNGETGAEIFGDHPGYPQLDWIVVGGESGPGSRPMHPDWVRSLRDQCADAGVPFFFKQWGEWGHTEAVANEHGGVDMVPPVSFRNTHRWRRWDGETCRAARDDESVGEFLEPGFISIPVGKKAAGRLLDGVEHNGMPEVLHG